MTLEEIIRHLVDVHGAHELHLRQVSWHTIDFYHRITFKDCEVDTSPKKIPDFTYHRIRP